MLGILYQNGSDVSVLFAGARSRRPRLDVFLAAAAGEEEGFRPGVVAVVQTFGAEPTSTLMSTHW